MPNPNVGLHTANAATDYSTCEHLASCLIAECDRYGGYPACTQNREIMAGHCIKDLDSVPLNKGFFDSVADRRLWADFILGSSILAYLGTHYSQGKTALDLCGNLTESFCDLSSSPGAICPTGDWLETGNVAHAEHNMGGVRACNACMLVSGRCTANYYGVIFSMNESGCYACPSLASVTGRSVAGSVTASECYIPAGNSFTDTTGSYTLATDCYYSE